MHPIMVTVPGWGFKLIAPALILWGLYSLIVGYNRRAMAKVKVREADAARAREQAARPRKVKRKAAGESTAAAKRKATEGEGTDAPEAATDASVSETAASEVPLEAPEIPPDNTLNSLISVAIGVGIFLYASPVHVGGAGMGRLFAALGAFGRGVVNRGVWTAAWTSLPIYSYGVMLGTSLVVGWYITLGLAERDGLPRQRMADCYVSTAFSAIIGARLLYVLTNLHEFSDPTQIFAMRSGGLVAYGGFLGGLIGSMIFLFRNGFSLWKWADAAVPSLATGLTITRLGCYMYGCDFGKPLGPSAPSFLRTLGTFPHWHDDKGSPAWQQQTVLGFRTEFNRCLEQFHGRWENGMCHLEQTAHSSVPVHPTQLYESLTGLSIFVVLMFMWRRRKFDGQIFLAFGALYGFARSALEIIRDDHERGFFLGLSTSQLIGLTTGVLAIVVYVVRQKNAPRSHGVNLFAPVTEEARAAGEKLAKREPAKSIPRD